MITITRILYIHAILSVNVFSTELCEMPSLCKMRFSDVGPSSVDKHPIGKNVEKMDFSEEILFHFFYKTMALRHKKNEDREERRRRFSTFFV
jgi:hypothetical protein